MVDKATEERYREEEARLIELVRKLARERGVSIRQLEARAGVTPSVLYKVLIGKVGMSLRHLLLMCDGLGLPWADFYALAAQEGGDEADLFEERVLAILARRGYVPKSEDLQ
jgi:transcriptional regulator with XRE-family HTH domain